MSSAPFIVPYCEAPVRVLYADTYLLVVDKPQGLLSVPGRELANRDCVPARLQPEYGVLRIVHRLDFDTSGLMILARDASTHRDLNRQFEQRSVEKRYEAIVWGLLRDDEGSIDLPICVDWPNRPKKIVDHINGKSALTRYRVLARDTQIQTTRLALMPVTGRSHQLRVHLAAIGHPILGCPFYAHAAARAAAPRLLLHALELTLTHPHSGERLTWRAPLPF